MQNSNNSSKENTSEEKQVSVPSLSLPKGGGAIRGMGEKFAANPVTGTGSLSVPIYTSPGRSGFGPQLSLSYDSGAGNGPFGLGWHLSIPSITRKTDKGFPKYLDKEESDVFILSGAEDLVPVDVKGSLPQRTFNNVTYEVKPYCPRVEGLFARIEQWTSLFSGEIHWRSISKENITTVYGKNSDSRIEDPEAPDGSLRIFSWLICESYDDKGNAIIYEYQPEDSTNIVLSNVNEKNRTEQSRSANRYLKYIKYGNKTPRQEGEDLSNRDDWLFEVVFDYGEHYRENDEGQTANVFLTEDDLQPWDVRQDPFSVYRAGFEVRTYRLCRRVLMSHNFEEELNTPDYLVRATHFDYDENPVASRITGVTQSGYKRQDDGTYLKKSLPPLEFEYSRATIQEEVQEVDAEYLENLPQGIDGSNYRWVDLDGEGISGILTEQGGSWFYKRNISSLPKEESDGTFSVAARFAPQEQLSTIPSPPNFSAGRQMLDLAGDGQLDVVAFDDPAPGFYERTHDEKWKPFRSFASLPNIPWRDPNLKFVDLTGDGHADILITEDEAFTWHLSLAEAGFGAGEKVRQALDEEKGPRLVFADGTQSIYLADLSGDGLTDLVRIRNGEICYWPNLGYGRFGAKVTMDNAPWFDHPDHFNQQRIRLADIDGSGVTDIIYLGRDGVYIYLNLSGNRWGEERKLKHFPHVDNLSSVMAVDLLGNGTACLVWSSSLPNDVNQPMRYIDLMGGQKPHLLIKTVNNLGAETHVHYAPSTKFYLADKLAGKPWITKIPFPVHCVEKISVTDKWRKTTFSTQYTYHHGYFDGIEREFRGFGRVDQVDVETYGEFIQGNEASPYITDDKTLYQPPVKTVTWYHTGAFLDREHILNQFQNEYFPNWLDEAGYSIDADYLFSERALAEPDMTGLDLSATEWREALRACKGMTLRQEVYELDVDALEEGRHLPVKLFTATAHNCQIHLIQPKADNPYAVFLVTESEALSYHYELDLKEKVLCPDPRIAHTLVLNTNKYGQPLQQAAVAYPRVRPFSNESSSLSSETEALIRQMQAEIHISYTETKYTNDVDLEEHYRLRLPYEVGTYELTGIRPQDEDDRETTNPWDDIYFTLEELRRFRLSEIYQNAGEEVEDIPYHHLPDRINPQKRRVEQIRTLYFDENLTDPMSLSELNHLGLQYETYKLALTDDLLDAILREKLEALVENGESYSAALTCILESGGYHRWDDQWWIRSGIAGFAYDASEHYYLPERYIDPFGEVTELTYDPYDLYIQKTVDPLGNTTSIEAFDFRVMSPTIMKDPNDNYSAVAFNTLGMPVATATMGKEQTESGDTLLQLQTDINLEEITTFFTAETYSEAQARTWLSQATGRFVYYFGEKVEADGSVTYGHHPACACAITREKHVNQLSAGESTPLQTVFEYSDGMGEVIVSKGQAEPETAGGAMRWLATGKTILNNKGKPVKQYEPYFSTNEQRFEETREVGVTPILYYDALGRVVRTRLPDGSFSRVEFIPWQAITFDQNDTVLEPGHDWYVQKSALTASEEEQRAAELTLLHADTPTTVFLDSLGREVISIENNRFVDETELVRDEKYVTFTKLDAEGKPLWIRDARGNLVMQYITPPVANDEQNDPASGFTPCYDIAGNLLFQHSMDGGDRWLISDVTGQSFYAWDLNGRVESDGTLSQEERITKTTYDGLRRPVMQELKINNEAWQTTERFFYGEAQLDAKTHNLRGQLFQHYDPSGRIMQARFDFAGNLLEEQKQLINDPKAEWIHWSDANLETALKPEIFYKQSEYDALNRITRFFNWHTDPNRVAVYEPHYNERGILESENLTIGAEKTDNGYTGGSTTLPVSEITYDAKGQRQSIRNGNGTRTHYSYDPLTFRLSQLRTTRPDFDPEFPNFHSGLTNANVLQQLSYMYDPVGNITEIYDEAYEPVFFQNQLVEPHSRYEYDALYHLIKAQGRESAKPTTAPDQAGQEPIGIQFPVTDQTLRNYTQHYTYDAVGNIMQMRHVANGGSWTRHYRYAQESNRLLKTWIGNNVTDAIDYQYDTHGSMLSLSNVTDDQRIRWDHRDMIGSSDLIGGGWAYYNYDSEKQRTRKTIERQNGTIEEQIYLDGMEIYRRWKNDQLVEKIETHHLIVDEQRVLMVEDVLRTDNNKLTEGILYRYHYSNHLGSVALELNENAHIISYEEYHPYGTSAYQAKNSSINAAAKRYRYTGKERDDETGLYYYGARYYAAWLGRWVSCDPKGDEEDVNFYHFTKNNPITYIDVKGRDVWRFLKDLINPKKITWLRVILKVISLTRAGPMVVPPVDISASSNVKAPAVTKPNEIRPPNLQRVKVMPKIGAPPPPPLESPVRLASPEEVRWQKATQLGSRLPEDVKLKLEQLRKELPVRQTSKPTTGRVPGRPLKTGSGAVKAAGKSSVVQRVASVSISKVLSIGSLAAEGAPLVLMSFNPYWCESMGPWVCGWSGEASKQMEKIRKEERREAFRQAWEEQMVEAVGPESYGFINFLEQERWIESQQAKKAGEPDPYPAMIRPEVP